MPIEFIADVYMQERPHIQYSFRVSGEQLEGVRSAIPKLDADITHSRKYDLPVVLKFKGTLMPGSDTTFSYYPQTGYLNFNINQGNALYNAVENRQPTTSAPHQKFIGTLTIMPSGSTIDLRRYP